MKDICRKNLTSLRDACNQIENDTVDFNYERYVQKQRYSDVPNSYCNAFGIFNCFSAFFEHKY